MADENKVTYIDANGQKKAGVTAETTQAPGFYDNMKGYYQTMYDEAVKANNDAAAAAAARALETTNQQIDQLEKQYAGTNKELYRNYMNQQRLLPQQLAAEGYSGGMSESARLRLGTAYEDALNNNQQALANDRAGLSAAYAKAQYDAQAAADAANAQALQQKYGYLAQLETNRYNEEQQRLQSRAETLAAYGDFSGYLALGYSQKEVDAMEARWKEINGLSGGGGAETYAPETKADYVTAYNRYMDSGKTEKAEAVRDSYYASSAYNGGDLVNPKKTGYSAADFAYWKNLAR